MRFAEDDVLAGLPGRQDGLEVTIDGSNLATSCPAE
jgi:hypothetical protein